MNLQGVNTRSTPLDDTPGVLDTGNNPRFKTAGEMWRRLGMARSNLAKVSGSITLINGFAIGQGQQFAIVGSSGQIDGQENPLALWGDAVLSPLTGNANLYVTYQIGISRATSQYAKSAIVYALNGRYPTDSNPGVYVGQIDFVPGATSGSTTWTPPAPGTWHFRAWPVRDGVIGPGANLTNTAINTLASAIMFTTRFGITSGVPNTFGIAPTAYMTTTTTVSFAYGQALLDGAITLPFTFSIGTTGTNTYDANDMLFVFSNLYGGSGYPKVLNGISTPGNYGTVTINTDGTTSLA